MNRYFLFSGIGNGIIKMSELWDVKIKRHTDKTTPILYVEKFMLISFSVLTGPFMFPFKSIDKIAEFEIKKRGLNIEDFDNNVRKDKYISDYII